MRVLVIKTSSLGDVIHTLPALSDAVNQHTDIQFDWVVEEAFTDLTLLHNAVRQSIPVALRRWRHQPLQAWRSGEWQRFKTQLQACHYSAVIDAQGLLKSALLTRLSRGHRYGLDRTSAREALASYAYHTGIQVAKNLHAITRLRLLFAAALNYPLPNSEPDFGIDHQRLPRSELTLPKPYLVFLHATTWSSKHWPESYWQQLLQIALGKGYHPVLPWGNEQERQQALRIAQTHSPDSVLATKLTLRQLTPLLADAAGMVGVDTGLAHLGAALGTPNITLYGSTTPALTGAWGRFQHNLAVDFACAPCLQRQCRLPPHDGLSPACFSSLSPSTVMTALEQQMELAVAKVSSVE